jgi:exopolysaccharide production protein ExoQ
MHVLAFILVVSFVLATLFPAIGRHSGFDMLELGHVGRWRGIFGHKNALGGVAAIGFAMFFLYGSLLRAPGPYLWLARISAACCLVLSGSSNSLIGAAAIVVATLLLRSGRAIRPSLLFGGFAVAAVIVVPLVDNLLIAWLGRDETLSGRTAIWEAVFLLWQQQPITGYGYGAGAELIRPLLQAMLFASAVDAHNGYLDILVETGILGFLAFVALLILVFRRGFQLVAQSERLDPSLCAALSILVGTSVMAIGEVAPFRMISVTGWTTYVSMCLILTARPDNP